MDRQKAVALLWEIIEIAKQETDITSITLNRDKLGDFSLKINCVLSDVGKNRIEPILVREGLGIKMENGFLIIYSARR